MAFIPPDGIIIDNNKSIVLLLILKRDMKKIYLLLLYFIFPVVSLMAQTDNSDCLVCHSDNSLEMERAGKKVNLYVNEETYGFSIHKDLSCNDCHEGFNPDDLPHKQGSKIWEVNCMNCHDTGNLSKSVHGQKNVQCYSCHGKHDIKPAVELSAVNNCVTCHNTSAIQAYYKSKHYTLYKSGRKDLSCYACHGGEGHNIQSAAFNKNKEKAVCGKCHTAFNTQFARELHSNFDAPEFPTCTNCHGSHASTVNRFSRQSQECLTCHLNPSIVTHQKASLTDFIKTYETSVHGISGKNGTEAATCADCHGNHLVDGIQSAVNRVKRENIPETCGRCHQDALKDFNNSAHGKSFASKSNLAPVCTDCHGEHDISAVKGKAYTKLKMKDVCQSCHAKNKEVLKLVGKSKDEILYYETSVHYRALKKGNDKAPTCADCHTGHLMLRASDPNSAINKKNIAMTCGKNSSCHLSERGQYKGSIHQVALMNGIKDAPTCTDCHGDHQNAAISRKGEIDKNQYIAKLCSDCHSNVQMAEKYGLPTNKTDSYYESYHGLAVRGGSKYAANCASCHNYHNVRPSSDPLSSINKANLSKTCGKCHPGASIESQFADVHLTYNQEQSALLYWTDKLYFWLVVVIIGGMLIHNLLDLYRKLKEKKEHAEEIKHLKKEGKYYVRMSFNERIQHFMLLTTFIGLVISGFGLVYPDAFWVEAIRSILGDRAFELRSITHRILGILMIIASFYHIYYLAFTKPGRQLFKDFFPAKHDITDAIVNIKFLLGISKEKPQFRRFSYMEKAEYWALLWGTIVMSVTGLFLMFNNYFLANTPKILLDFSTLVHFYEAWLASLAIVVWHFYYVIFNPEVYPLNTAFLDGKMSEHLMEAEHPLYLKELQEQEKNENKRETKESE